MYMPNLYPVQRFKEPYIIITSMRETVCYMLYRYSTAVKDFYEDYPNEVILVISVHFSIDEIELLFK